MRLTHLLGLVALSAAAVPSAALAGSTGGPSHGRDYPSVVHATPGLASYWRFEEAAGPTLRDETGAAPATARPEVTFALPGAFRRSPGQALGFEGGDPDQVWESRVVLDERGRYAFSGRAPFTVEAWVRPGLLDTGSRRILSMEDAGGGWLLAARADATVASRFNLAPATPAPGPDTDPVVTTDWDTVAGPVLRLGKWSHVVVNYTGRNLRLYVNGRRVGRVASRQELRPRPGVALTIGAKTSTYLEWEGRIDEVAIYDRALRYREVRRHYWAGRLHR